VIVKVGGSLLAWDELPQRLQAWLARRPAGTYFLIAGAGPLGDVIRQADERFHLGEERSHWLCVDALAITARLLSHLLDDAPLIDTLTALRQMRDSRDGVTKSYVFDPRSFLREVEPTQGGNRLPHTWDVTTDSIAARLVECASADELVLLKSCDPAATIIDAACDAGYVDRHFAQAARTLDRVTCVNLRGTGEPVLLRRPSHGG